MPPISRNSVVQRRRKATLPLNASTDERDAVGFPPPHRLLRGYAFDPSLATQVATALVSEVTFRVPWEPVAPGPIGEYIEVVDVDPASNAAYAPVDLDAPFVLAQQGLPPSEGNPQFHQQMVYAATMATIDRFERALGRKAFWADRQTLTGTEDTGDEFVQRLRVYPHALRMPNAYYSHEKRALLFGYFPATEDRTSGQYPGGMVFTCLSNDIVAHETTHALLDGFHEYFLEATNPDVLAFHEAFSDIVALLQRFSFPEILVHQIALTRGDLSSENLLGQLATQFGRARGAHGALRDAIGHVDPKTRQWIRREPDPSALDRTMAVHARGAVLVAAVFDAFLAIYRARTQDLLRLASGGTGVLKEGALHPDLVRRLADEAARAASHVLNICIRALDYCPPVDLTFGEYLRALITADADLMPADAHGYRVAFIEAFRRRGIYPCDVRTLSEDSLRWERPGDDPEMAPGEMEQALQHFVEATRLRQHIDRLRYKKSRREIWTASRDARIDLHSKIRDVVSKGRLLERATGLVLTRASLPTMPATVKLSSHGRPVFAVQALREARRLREDGRVLNQVFVTLLQTEYVAHNGEQFPVRCGSTLVIDLNEAKVTYVIRKALGDQRRLERTAAFREGEAGDASLAAAYFGESAEPFAALHHLGA